MLDNYWQLGMDVYSSKIARSHIRDWYGEDGELLRTLPCPDCRGRGYIVCPQCEITIDFSCAQCAGKVGDFL